MAEAATTGLANFRDLGGLPTYTGRFTQPGVLFRSDAPAVGDTPPPGAVWPPALVVDLRSADEPIEPHPLRTRGTAIHRFMLLGAARPHTLRELRAAARFDLDGLYDELVIRAGRVLPEVLSLLVDAAGPALVHCAAGKDRTGVLVALLLRCAGVTREAVIADYVCTAGAMVDVRHRMLADDKEIQQLFDEFPEAVGAPADAIASVLACTEAGAGFGAWLTGHGVTEGLSRLWTERLCTPGVEQTSPESLSQSHRFGPAEDASS
jgi:protein-tyrosine phosphatase